MLLEDLESALDRGAKIYAEVLGFGSAEEGLDMMRCEINGRALTRSVEAALNIAKLDTSEIDYVCAHGNSMPDYDIAETNAFKLVFGERAYKIPVSSIKSMTGQALAAGGGFQVVASCLTLQNGIVPPTINYEIPDPNCNLDYVPNQARAVRVRTVLINAHSLGETHSVLILGQYLKRQ